MLVFGIIICVIGLLLLAAYLSDILLCRTRIDAVIVRCKTKKFYFRGVTRTEYTPVFTYTVDGKSYTATAYRSTKDPNRFRKGQTIQVCINPRRPASVRYGSYIGFLVSALILIALGAGIIVLWML